jgi:hypothetical protein
MDSAESDIWAMASAVKADELAKGRLTAPVKTNAAGEPVAEMPACPDDFDPYGASPSAMPAASQAPHAAASRPDDRLAQFRRRRCKVRFDLHEGSLHVSALDARKAGNGFMVLHDLASESPLFEPKIGSTLGLAVNGGAAVQVYYPGIKADIPELGIGALVFVEAGQ